MDKISFCIGKMTDPVSHLPFGYEVRVEDKLYLRFFSGHIVCLEGCGYEVFSRDFLSFTWDRFFTDVFEEWSETYV